LIKHIFKSEKYALFLTLCTSTLSTVYVSVNDISLLNLFAGLSFSFAILLPLIWIHTTFPINFFYHKTLTQSKHILAEYFIANRYVFLIFLPFVSLFLNSLFLAVSLLANLVFHFISTALWFNNTGSNSIPWRTGKKGNSVRSLALETGSVALPIGSIPSQVRTLGAVLTNASFVYLTVFIPENYLLSILLFPLFLGIILFRITKISHFVGNHAFFDEYFKPDSISSVPKPIQFESLYWIPKSFRTDARFILTQHIRSQSISRIHLAFHILFWFFVIINPDWFNTYIGLFLLGLLLTIESFSLLKQSISNYYSNFLVKSFSNIYLTHLYCMSRWIPAYFIAIAYSFSFSSIIFWVIGMLILLVLQSVLSLFSVLTLKQISKNDYA